MMYWANMETRNFTFDTFASSEEEAKDLMREAWRIHTRQVGKDSYWLYEWHDLEDSVRVMFVAEGIALRDAEPLLVKSRTGRA
jgi:hypothetical protein